MNRRQPPFRSILPALVALGVAFPLAAQGTGPWVLGPENKFVASDAVNLDGMGGSVMVRGDLAVIGVGAHDHFVGTTQVFDSGAAIVLRRGVAGWSFEAELLPSNLTFPAQWHFGSAVAVDGNTIVCGAPRHDGFCGGGNFCDAGAVYVFVHNGTNWVQEAFVLSSDLAGSDRFGTSVAIQGDTLVVGASNKHLAGSGAGAAYVFERSGGVWTETQKLIPSDLTARIGLGSSVSIDGNVLVVGASLHDFGSSFSSDLGAAYVFRKIGSSWVEEQRLEAADPFFFMRFGASVSVSGDRVLVGGPGDSQLNNGAGSAYVFERSGSTWAQTQKLQLSNPFQQVHFGEAVSLRGDRCLIGTSPTLGGPAGAYVFEASGSNWSQVLEFVGSDTNGPDRFGVSVSLSDDALLVGADNHNGGAPGSGAAYLYDIEFLFTPFCNAVANSTGSAAQLVASGSSSLGANDLVLSASSLPQLKPSLFLYSATPASIPFGDGVLCLTGGLRRLGPLAQSDASGTVQRPIDYTAPPFNAGPGAITAGSTWRFQCWFRDPQGGPAGFNLSTGLAVQFVP